MPKYNFPMVLGTELRIAPEYEINQAKLCGEKFEMSGPDGTVTGYKWGEHIYITEMKIIPEGK